MRLDPIEHPTNLFAKIAYWASRRRLGKVMTPMKVIYARVPKLFPLAYRQAQIIEKGLTIPLELRYLVTGLVAALNGCSFCVDIGKAAATYARVSREKLDAVTDYRTHAAFTASDRAALAYVDEATRQKRVADTTFARLRQHFDDRAIVEITWLSATENYYNLMAIPLEIDADGLCAIAERRAS